MRKWILIRNMTMMMVLAAVFFCTACENQFVKESAFRRSAASTSTSAGRKNLSLVTWNVETFFDAVTSGSEYKEFKNSERWNKDKYVKRLEKLCEVMTSLNPDIFVMEEIENEAVVQDIANALAGGSWDNKKKWQYACFAKETGSAIGCAVFSRYELSRLRTHSLDIRTQAESQPSSRPLMQVTVNVGSYEVELFVNHWKSKSGGEDETEIWRDWQELVLAESAAEAASGPDQKVPLIICGDFNRSAEDFILQPAHGKKGVNILLRGSAHNLPVTSPWFRSDGKFATETGSYFYSGDWERIDNIMIYGDLEIAAFTPVKEAPLADEEGRPLSYKIYTGEGYSDHLPLKCVLTFL